MSGSLTRATCYTIGYCIVKVWTNLVYFWCKSSRIHSDFIKPHLYAIWFKWNIVFVWLVLLPIDILSVWYTPGCYKEGCINTQVSCINRSFQGAALTINAIIGVMCIMYLISALNKLRTGGTAALFKGTWAYSNSDARSSAPVPAFSESSVAHSLDPDVESIFVYEKQPSLLPQPLAAHNITSSAPTSRRNQSGDSESDFNNSAEPRDSSASTYRRSNVELTNSLLTSHNERYESEAPSPRAHQVSTESDNGTVDGIMRKQTMRIVLYVSILLLLTCGVISYDVTFCTSEDIEDIVYKSPPCDARDVLRASFNLYYTGTREGRM